jgi:hypothetical protein
VLLSRAREAELRGYDAVVSTGSPRVFELARRPNVTSKQILEWSAELTKDGPSSAQSRLDPELVDALTTRAHGALDPSRKQEGARLIRDAFQQARDAGKPEHIAVAVLKNRILAITGRTFTESHWGVGTFGDFLGLYPELVDVDPSSRPAAVNLRDDLAERPPAQPRLPDSWTGPQLRIRGDLWRAIVDLTGNSVYVWRDGEAVPLAPSERPPKWPRLPTATSADMSLWRSDFAERITQSPRWAGAAASLTRWIEHAIVWMAVPHRVPDRSTLDAGARVRRNRVLVTCSGIVPTPIGEQRHDPYFYERTLQEESSCASVQTFRASDAADTLNLRIFVAGILVSAAIGILLEAFVTGKIDRATDRP